MSTTNITLASQEFNKVRGGNATIQVSNSGDAFGANTAGPASASPSATSSTLTLQQLSDKVNKLQSYTPALIGVLAANALIMLALVGVGIFFLVRKTTKRRGYRRRGNNTISTMELASPAPAAETGSMGTGGTGAKYEAVSMHNPDGTPAYETPAYRQSTAVSFRMTDEPNRDSAIL